MQWTTRVNEAYRTLKSPVRRAKYLLELNGVDVAFETSTAMPKDFLAEQLELREKLGEARDVATLGVIQKNLAAHKRAIESQIAENIDVKRDYETSKNLVRKLMFLEKFGEEIDAAFEALEA